MSLRVNKDNIFFILPENRYGISDRIDGFMDEDFTLHITAKIYPEQLTEEESFMFSRNGMHSGISVFNDEFKCTYVMFTYWFTRQDGSATPKQVLYKLSDTEQIEYNKYTIIGDHTKDKKISCYINDKLVGEILYENDTKHSHKNSFYWFGCGSMLGPEEHRGYGDFEYKFCFVLNKVISINVVDDLLENYESNYTEINYKDFKKLKNDYPLKDNFAFLCDFKQYNKYKIWDLSFNGNYPQFYIEHNIYF